MKCNQSRPWFELVSLCPFPTTITITPRATPLHYEHLLNSNTVSFDIVTDVLQRDSFVPFLSLIRLNYVQILSIYLKEKWFHLKEIDNIYNNYCCILTFDPAKHAIPKWCTGRKWHIPMASNRKKSRRQIWLTKWEAHDTLIDWCTGREWPLNYMTVISAWWRSNMPFQRLSGWFSGRLNNLVGTGSQWVGVPTS